MIIQTSYLHYDINAGPNNVIQVFFNAPWVNVILLDNLNYQNYINKTPYTYFGGLAEISPFNIRPPRNDHWHLVVDQGGQPLTTGASVKII